MKKFLVLLSVVLAFAFVQAETITAPTIYGPTEWECFYGANLTHADDSLSAADTIDFSGLIKHAFDPGYEYFLRSKVSVPSADTIRFELLSYGSDGSTLFETTSFDTIMSTATERISKLPIGSTILPRLCKFTLVAGGLRFKIFPFPASVIRARAQTVTKAGSVTRLMGWMERVIV